MDGDDENDCDAMLATRKVAQTSPTPVYKNGAGPIGPN